MLRDQEYRVSKFTEPFLDVDVIDDDVWIGISSTKVMSDRFEFKLPISPRFPLIRFLNEERLLVIDSRTSRDLDNGFILDKDGNILTTFFAGDAIEDVVVCNDYIVASYFDEAFGGTGVESNGLSIFDLWGRFQYGYNTHFGSDAVDVFDCYACTQVGTNRVMFYCYTEFPLVIFDVEARTQQVFHPPENVIGSKAITKRGNRVYFHGPYDDKSGVYEWLINRVEASRIDAYTSPLRGLPRGRFLSHGTVGYTIVSVADK